MSARDLPITGVTVSRAIERGGGLWSAGDVADEVGYARATIEAWTSGPRAKPDFPHPCAYIRESHPRTPLYAGVDVLAWFENTNRYACAEAFYEGVIRRQAGLRQQQQQHPRERK